MNRELTNNFSWRRFGMVAAFYFPRLKKQIIFYPILSLLTLLMTIAVARYEAVPMGLVTMIGFASSIAMCFGPAIFTYREGPETETMLPANSKEKALFIMSYSIIAIPLLLSIFTLLFGNMTQELMTSAVFTSKLVPETEEAIVSADVIGKFITDIRSNGTILMISSIIGIFPCIMSLYVTMRARYNRIAWCLVWNIVYIVALGFIAFVSGIIAGINSEAGAYFENVSRTAANEHEAINSIMDFTSLLVQDVAVAMGVFTIVVAVVLLVLTYRAIVKRQIV